jgi:hypothetical protein
MMKSHADVDEMTFGFARFDCGRVYHSQARLYDGGVIGLRYVLASRQDDPWD